MLKLSPWSDVSFLQIGGGSRTSGDTMMKRNSFVCSSSKSSAVIQKSNKPSISHCK